MALSVALWDARPVIGLYEKLWSRYTMECDLDVFYSFASSTYDDSSSLNWFRIIFQKGVRVTNVIFYIRYLHC